MKKLCLVTYARKGEDFTLGFHATALALNALMQGDFKVVLCGEGNLPVCEVPYVVEVRESRGTKYRKLLSLLENDDSQYYFSFDNDTELETLEVREFVSLLISNGADIGWGIVRARRPVGFIPKLVAVDKLLSHDLIRPILWRLGVGVSVPGQAFGIRGAAFRGKLIGLDTYLDDLALGLYANAGRMKRCIVGRVLGYEKPNECFSGLWSQRKRWAIGYGAVLRKTLFRGRSALNVALHGLAYHGLWLVHWLIAIGLAFKHPLLAAGYCLVTGLIIVGTEWKLIPYALVYQIVFPLFHVRWWVSLLLYLAGRRSKCR